MALVAILAAGQLIDGHRPFPCVVVDAQAWQYAADLLAAGELTLLSVWGETGRVHMAVLQDAAPTVVVLSMECADNLYPSVGRVHAPAIRLERAMRDLIGLDPVGLPDTRPWFDHGSWGDTPPPAYDFLPVTGESLHQIPVGPVHAGIIEPGHFRFTCDGETVVRLEQRLGYVHKGIDALLHGAPIPRACALAGRTSGDSTVAYAFAFSLAVEAALGIAVPPRSVALRGVMAELERIANHLGDFGAICNDASFSIMLAHCGVLREQVLRCAAACFGHRLMMDRIVPGGVATDLSDDGVARIGALVERSARALRPAGRRCTTAPRRCRTAPSAPASCAPNSHCAFRCRRLCRPRLRPRFRRAADARLSPV